MNPKYKTLLFLFVLFGQTPQINYIICILTAEQRSTVKDETVEELENSKAVFADRKSDGVSGADNVLSISKSQKFIFSDVNGRKSGHEEMKNEVEKNGKIMAKISQKIDSLKDKEEQPKSVVRTEIEIPSQGIHRVINSNENTEFAKEKKKDNNPEFKRARNGMDKLNSFSEIKYGPRDMAEYIFWTGDEKGVALTIEEFLQEGLMTRREAVNFLQSIKYNLDLMQSQYQSLEKISDKLSNEESLKRKLLKKEKFIQMPKEDLLEKEQNIRRLLPVGALNIKSGISEVLRDNKISKQNSFGGRLNLAKNNSNKKDFETTSKSYSKFALGAKNFDGSLSDNDYNEYMESSRVAGLPQKESSLEEIVFELAKVMFSEGLVKGNKEAQKAIQKFGNFLQDQVQHRQLSVNLQRKILDVLLSALLDALSDNPELIEKLLSDRIIWDKSSLTSEALKELLQLGTKQLSDQPISKEELS